MKARMGGIAAPAPRGLALLFLLPLLALLLSGCGFNSIPTYLPV